MTIDQLRRFLSSDLDSVQLGTFGNQVEVVFRAAQNTTQGMLLLLVNLETRRFDVGSSSTAMSSLFLAQADAYARAASFVRASGLTSW